MRIPTSIRGTSLSDEAKTVIISVSVVLLIVGLVVAVCVPVRQERMTIRSCGWKYIIQEREDYQVWVCHTRHRQNCTGFGDNRKCRDESYQACGYEIKTRVHNTWVTGGEYPTAPFWETNYTIRPGNYERRWEDYTVMFSDDKKLYPYHPGSLGEYSGFTPRQARDVKLNLFSHITEVVSK